MHAFSSSLLVAALAGASLGLAGCQSPPPDSGTVEVIETPHSAAEVATFTTTATVTGIDAAKRKLTLATADGHRTTCKAGPDVVNFNQIKVGDVVNATVTEEFAIMLTPGGGPLTAADGTTVALAPIGARPGAYVADAASTTARVEQVWPADHKVRLLFANGESKIIKVGKDIDLVHVQPGNDVTVQMAESLAIDVRKP